MIAVNPAYSTVILGKPPSEYSHWIMKKESWGGAIELAIFSELFKIEIISVDVSTGRLDRFGKITSSHQ